jgi:hypothetical protein
MLVNVYYAAIAALLAGIILLFRHISSYRAFPSAPGPKLAAFTHFWYLWKVWKGHFEEYNIQEHESQGMIL